MRFIFWSCVYGWHFRILSVFSDSDSDHLPASDFVLYDLTGMKGVNNNELSPPLLNPKGATCASGERFCSPSELNRPLSVQIQRVGDLTLCRSLRLYSVVRTVPAHCPLSKLRGTVQDTVHFLDLLFPPRRRYKRKTPLDKYKFEFHSFPFTQGRI